MNDKDFNRDEAIASRCLLLDYPPVSFYVGDEEPTRYIQRKSGVISLLADTPDHGEKHVPIGSFQTALVDINSAMGNENLFDVFEADSQSMCDLYHHLFDDEAQNYAERVFQLTEYETFNSFNLLVVERLTNSFCA
jgi:hypothetical protein